MHDHTKQQLEKFDKEIGDKMSGKHLFGYIDGLDNRDAENVKIFLQQALKSQAEEIESRLFTTTISKSSDVYEVWYEEMKPILNEYIKVD